MTVARQQSVLTLVGWVALCLSAGGLGSLVTTPKIPTWYSSLVKPWWNPPNWVFGPGWTMLYVLMGIGVWMVWSAWAERASYAAGTYARTGLRWFSVQLLLNVACSLLFFQGER